MQRISDERLLSLKKEDLVVENYDTFVEYAEAKLKCGLYVYWIGDDDNSYGRGEFIFSGSLKNLLITDRSYKEIKSDDERFIFTKTYLEYCRERDKLIKTDFVYLKMEEIAKNIIKESGETILFYELENYISDLLNKSELELKHALNLLYPLMKPILDEVKKQKIVEPKKLSEEEIRRSIIDEVKKIREERNMREEGNMRSSFAISEGEEFDDDFSVTQK